METFIIGHAAPSLPVVAAIARGAYSVTVGDAALGRLAESRAAVEKAAAGSERFYGITTGVGSLADTQLSPAQQVETQIALIRSHAAGVGDPLAPEIVRGAMFLRAQALAKGYSGVTPEVVQRFVCVLESGFVPVIPSIGSLGCSGDLAQLAHLAAVLFLVEGEVIREDGQVVPAVEMHTALGLEPIVLGAKEGLSLINGTEFMAASLSLTLTDAVHVLAAADLASGLTRTALLAHPDAVSVFAHSLRPHPGQLASAANARDMLLPEDVLAPLRVQVGSVEPQDPYSIRCTPQVHGAVAGVLAHTRGVVTIEVDSCTDNPAVTLDEEPIRVVSHGNFHGAPLAYCADYAKIALADLAALSERRIARLIDDKLSRGLPPYLVAESGPNSGFMIPHYTTAALVNRMRARGANASDTVPTSAGWEDHVSMGWNACVALKESLRDLAQVVAVELMVAAQAVELRMPVAQLPPELAEAHTAVRAVAPRLGDDRVLSGEMTALARAVLAGDFAPSCFVSRYFAIA